MDVKTLFKRFTDLKVIVLGDMMIDAYIKGDVNRVSPEAPVPIVNFSQSENRLGGAGNVALNLISLGAKVAISTVIGEDEDAQIMEDLIQKEGIDTDGVVHSNDRQTTVKTRVLGNQQQLLRIDKEQTDDITAKEESLLLARLEVMLKKGYDAIIFQDYNKGVLTKTVIQKVIGLAQKYKVLTTVDPKLKNFLSYQGVSLFKPNLKELKEGLQAEIHFPGNKESFMSAISQLQKAIQPEIIFVTLSEHGVFIQEEKPHFIPAHERTISDVSGAGDTVISVATLCLAAGVDVKNLAALANLAGGIVCEYRGVVAIQKEQLRKEAEKVGILCG